VRGRVRVRGRGRGSLLETVQVVDVEAEHLGQLEVLDAVVVPHLVGDEPRDEDEPG